MLQKSDIEYGIWQKSGKLKPGTFWLKEQNYTLKYHDLKKDDFKRFNFLNDYDIKEHTNLT